jgi:glycosyltransferase involved in cell wall biosynthesis
MNPPFFSVIMPVYNGEEYLEEAIASVRAQTFSDWELVMVDDGSRDTCPEIIARLSAADARIRAVRQENKGVSGATNRGLSLARAAWICYLDNDDIWFPETLARYREYIASHPQTQFCYGYRHRLRDGKVTRLKGLFQDTTTGPREVFENSYLSPMRVCHRRELLAKVGGYDETLRSMQDYDFFLRMSIHVPLEPINYATGLRRRHGNNLSQQSGFNRLLEVAILLRFLEHFGGKQAIGSEMVARRLGRTFYSAGREYFRAGCYRQALAALAEGSAYTLPWKALWLRLAAYLLLPWSNMDKRASPIPLSEPRCDVALQ